MLSVVVFTWTPFQNQMESIPSQKIVKYGADHVNKHFKMISRNLNIPFKYFLFTDRVYGEYDKDIEVMPLWDFCRDLGGCYNRLFTFSPDIRILVGDRAVYMDLDMIITGDITPFLDRNEDFVYFKMKGSDGTGWRMNNGMYMMDTGSRAFVWDDFIRDPQSAIAKRKGSGTDQGWTNYILDLEEEHHWTQGQGIYDMRLDFLETGRTELPEDCRIVMWAGPRDPSVGDWSKYPWVEKYYTNI
jgi:hypothetical protein